MGKRAKRDVPDGSPSRADEMRLVAAEAMAASLEVIGRKGSKPCDLCESTAAAAVAIAAALIERDAARTRLEAARAERRTKPTGTGAPPATEPPRR
jgi:hypothetical protein